MSADEMMICVRCTTHRPVGEEDGVFNVDCWDLPIFVAGHGDEAAVDERLGEAVNAHLAAIREAGEDVAAYLRRHGVNIEEPTPARAGDWRPTASLVAVHA